MVNRSGTVERTFAALGDPTRRAMVERLARGDATVSELAAPFAMSLAAASKHLRILTEAGLVKRTKQGRTVTCTLRPSVVRHAAAWLDRTRARWERRLDRLAALVQEEEP